VLIALIGIIATYFNIVEMLFYIKDYQYVIFIVDIISLIIYFYISIKNTLRINIEEAQEEKIYTLETYNKTLQIMYDSIRGFRHDFSNVVQGLEGYAEAEDIEGVKKMCKSLLKDCRDVNNMGILDPKIINNPSLYAILTNKFYIANQENVNMSIDVMFDLQNLNADSYELARIIGILLDNAIEAAKKCEERNVYVRFIKDTRVNRKLIIIENNYEEDNVDMSKLFEKGYTTKQNEEGKHG
jgi:two-component system sensor histidine kinase AgrC